MLYRVVIDGTDMLDFSDPSLVLLSPQVEIELDTSGSFEFTVPPNHLYYNDFTPESIMKMTVEVWEDSVLHWFGRPIEYHLDFFKNKKINCEGALAYFNDSVIRSEEWDQSSLSTIFASVISEHNSMVPSNRRFTVGNFTVSDRPVYRKFNYEQTFDVLKSKFLDAEEGHFFVRRENGVNYIDFLKDMPYSCNQDVEFAENLLNFTYNFDGKDFATCVIPLGGIDQETGKPIDIKSVNGGSDILVGNSAVNYGNIVRVQQYSDIEDPSELVSEGQKYLTTLQYNAFLIECSAVDLHSKDGSQQQFRVGQMVNCISIPHGIQLQLPISKMILYLDSAAKQITLGRIPKKTLSRFYKEKITDGGSGSGTEGIDEIPEGWTIVPPDTDGGEPTLKKVPIAIQITHQPLQINYTQESNIFDINGLEVKAVATAQPVTYFSDERYPTGVIPHSELSFSASDGNQYYTLVPGQTNILSLHKAKILVGVYWYCPYDNKKHIASFYITNKVQEAIDDSMIPHHIEIVTPPAQLEYFTGGHIHLSGAKVVAYLENGQPYTGNGYANGVIPNSELTLVPAIADKDQAHEGDTEHSYDGQTITTAKSVTWSWMQPRAGWDPYLITCTAYSEDYIVALGTESRATLHALSKSPNPEQRSGGTYGTPPSEPHDDPFTPQQPGSYYADGGYKPFYQAYRQRGYKDSGMLEWLGSLPIYNLRLDEAAKIIFEGTETKINAQQTIKVQWTTPQGSVLETSYEITVKESQHGR